MMLIRKRNISWMAIIVLTLIPVLFWALAEPLSMRFINATGVMLSIGQIAALTGAALFAINIILSARIRRLEMFFNGLNKVYEQHARIGQIAFILLLIHPLLLIPNYAGNSSQALRFLVANPNFKITLGGLGLLLMIVLIVLTLFLRPKYDIWKWTHKFFGAAFFLGSLHIYFIPSDTSRFMPLRFYMLGLVLLALITFVYRTLLGKYLVKKYRYVVSGVNQLNKDVIEVVLSPEGKHMKFRPGQFMFISFFDENISHESHPFTLSSSPDEKDLRITVKNLGDYTNKLSDLSVGSKAEIEGPFGAFSYKNAISKKQIWIAGGIGITPFLSMVRSVSRDKDYSVDLYYSVRNADEMVHGEILERLKSETLKVIPFFSKIKGRLNANAVSEISGGLEGKSIFICAPVPMIHSLKKQFIRKGIPRKYIHSEEFDFF